MSWKTDSKTAPFASVAPYQDGTTVAPSASYIGENRFRLPVDAENPSPDGSFETRQSVWSPGHPIVFG
jgi:hypothetical protein